LLPTSGGTMRSHHPGVRRGQVPVPQDALVCTPAGDRKQLGAAGLERSCLKLATLFGWTPTSSGWIRLHIFSNMRRLSRIGIFSVRSASSCATSSAACEGFEAIEASLRERYLTDQGLAAFSRSTHGGREDALAAQRSVGVIEQFKEHSAVCEMHSYKADAAVLASTVRSRLAEAMSA